MIEHWLKFKAICNCIYFSFQTLASQYFEAVVVQVGTSNIPNGTIQEMTLVTRCSYMAYGAKDNSEVVFDCGNQGIQGNTISIQNLHYNLSLLEVEILGNFKI